MATTQISPDEAAAPAAYTKHGLSRRRRFAGERPAPLVLAAVLAVAVLYAAFASGATGIPDESRLQGIVAVLALGTLAAALFGALRFEASPGAVLGVGLIGAFALWSALSITWSVAPDETWIEANRALAYAAVAAAAIALGASLPRAAERVAFGYLTLATIVALYALGGKFIPWFSIPGVIDLNHTQQIARLRAPLEYWNALGLFVVMAMPIAVRAAADAARSPRARFVALAALIFLNTTLMLTLSRGGLLVGIAALVLLVYLGPDRLATVAVAVIGAVGAFPPVLVGVTVPQLTNTGVEQVSASARAAPGLLMLIMAVVGLALAALLLRALIRREDRLVLSDAGRARLRRAALIGAGAALVLAFGALATSDRGVGGTISDRVDAFTTPKGDRQNDPSRVLQTNSGNRWVWWKEAAGSWSDRPLVGHGAGSFPLIHRAYRDNSLEVRQPHSVPLEFLTETGLIGAALALGGLALLGLAATRQTAARPPGRERAYAAALLCAGLAWALHLWIDWDWDIPAVTLPALIFLGVLAGAPLAAAAPGRGAITQRVARFGISRRAGLAIGAAAASLFALSAALPALSEKYTDDAFTLAAKGGRENLREAAEKASLAKRLNPYSVQPVFAAATVAVRSGQTERSGDLLVEALERQRNNPATWSRLARYQALIGDTPGALRSARTARSLDPEDSGAILLSLVGLFDDAASATATGTPLPEKIPGLEPVDEVKPPADQPPAGVAPTTPAPARPTPQVPATPAPKPRTPAPRPKPRPAPRQPQGEPFRLEG